jgi:PAS domain-containing protein
MSPVRVSARRYAAAMPQPKVKNLALILARDLAEHVGTPVFLVDPDGTLVFYNEAAEAILGQPFVEAGELSRDEWGINWRPRDPATGLVLTLDELPLVRTLAHRHAAHRRMLIRGLDDVDRVIDVVAFPLIANDELVGGVALFWEPHGGEE